MKLTAVEQRAIQRFCDENNCKPALSVFPLQVNFIDKDTGEKITKTLTWLVDVHKMSLKEESVMAKDEKRLKEQKAYQDRIRKKITWQ